MADYTRAVKDILGRNGFSFKRHGKGDHDIWKNKDGTITIAVDNAIKGKYFANRILKKAGINERL